LQRLDLGELAEPVAIAPGKEPGVPTVNSIPLAKVANRAMLCRMGDVLQLIWVVTGFFRPEPRGDLDPSPPAQRPAQKSAEAGRLQHFRSLPLWQAL
jgi:hypothetical protein